MNKRMTKAKYAQFMKNVRQGGWPSELSDLGFHPPSYGMPLN